MKQEDKDLLLKDLCARLPYRVKGVEANTLCSLNTMTHFKSIIKNIEYKIEHLGFRPYLFPLSSMTKEQEDEWYRLHVQPLFDRLGVNNRKEDLILQAKSLYVGIDYLIANHFDYRGLIEKGLAIDCTNLNIY